MFGTMQCYNAFNVYCRELAPGTVSLTGYRAQGDDGKHCAYCKSLYLPVLQLVWRYRVAVDIVT